MSTNFMQVAQCITDDRGIIVEADPAYLDIVGRRLHQIVGRSPLDFTAPDDRAVNHALLRRLGEQGRAFRITKRYVRGDGTLQWVSNHVSAVSAGTGATRFVATCRPHGDPEPAGSLLRARRDTARLLDAIGLAKHGFGGDLIGAPALELLLHLHLAELECRVPAPACLAAAIGQSVATTVRWVRVLATRDLVEAERGADIDAATPLRIAAAAQRMVEGVVSLSSPTA